MDKASLTEIDQQAESLLLRLYQLWQQSNTLPNSHKRLLVEALKEDSLSQQELQVVVEELRSQNEELVALETTRSNLEKQVEALTIELAKANQQIQQEIVRRQRVEAELRHKIASELYQPMLRLNNQLESQLQERIVQLQRSLDFEATLKRISDDVRDTFDERQILQTVVWELAVVLNTHGCNMGLYDAELTTSTICYEDTIGIDAEGQVIKMQVFPEGYRQLLQGQYFQFCESVPTWRTPAAILTCPICDERGAIGDLWLYKQPDAVFDELEVRLVQQMANQCAIAIRQARLYQVAQLKIQELEILNRHQDEFLDTISHELRTPLTNIKMAIQMLGTILNPGQNLSAQVSREGTGQSKLNRYLQILQKECDRELNLINNLLDLQELSHKAQSSVLTSIRIQNWLPQVVEPFLERACNNKQTLSVNISPDLPRLICEPSTLERVMTELLNNACKFTPPGEKIALTVRAQSGIIQFSVCNSGVEIPATQLSRIFDKFYRIRSYDFWNQGGTGLGLAIVQQLVALLGGRIVVESAKQQTCFTVELPLN